MVRRFLDIESALPGSTARRNNNQDCDSTNHNSMKEEARIRVTARAGTPTAQVSARVSNAALLKFLEWTHGFPSPTWVFRGHSNSCQELQPKIGRFAEKYDVSKEIRLFDEFKRWSVQYISPIITCDWDWLAQAQHHGLPTRFLDWTRNPLIAAFFACHEKEDEDGGVVAINADELGYGDRNGSPFDIAADKMFLAQPIFGRIINQHGLFSIHCKPDRPLNIDNKGTSSEWYKIPATHKQTLLRGLYNIGVDHSFVVPDMDGLARKLTWCYKHDLI